MRHVHWPVSQRDWDRAFLLVLPVLAVATAVGVFFGGPLDNAIVLGWAPSLWLLARSLKKSTIKGTIKGTF